MSIVSYRATDCSEDAETSRGLTSQRGPICHVSMHIIIIFYHDFVHTILQSVWALYYTDHQ